MATSVEHLFAEALELDNDNRLELAELLMGSVAIDPEIFAEHLAVAHDRLEEFLSGEITPVSREDTLQRVQQLLRKGSAA